MIVGSLDLVLNYRTHMVAGGREVIVTEPPKVSMRMSQGLGREWSRLSGSDACPPGSTEERFDDFVYASGFAELHAGEESSPWFDLRGWVAGAGGSFAQRSYTQKAGNFGEKATFTLHHTPAP